MYGSRGTRRDSGGSTDSGGSEGVRGRPRAANERASPALYWVPDHALPGGAPALARGSAGSKQQRNAAPPALPRPTGSWDFAPPGRPPRFAQQTGVVGASPRAATPPGRLPPAVRNAPGSARVPPPPAEDNWYAQPPSARSSGDAQRDYGGRDSALSAAAGEPLGAGGDARLGALISDNLALLRNLMSGGAVPGAEPAGGDGVGALRSSLGAALPRRASSWNGAATAPAPATEERWDSPPARTRAGRDSYGSSQGRESYGGPPGRDSYGGSAVGVATVPWPPQPPPRVSESFAGFLRPAPAPAPSRRVAPGILEYGEDDPGAGAPDVLSAALQRRLQQQARELDDARRRTAELEAALEAAHSQADQAIAATAATAAAAASAADAAMSSPALAALIRRVEDAEMRAAQASEEAEGRAADAEARAAEAEERAAAAEERAAAAEERAAAAEERAEAAAEDAKTRIAAATSDALRVQITQRHFDTATNAAAEAIAAAEAHAADAEAAMNAATQAVAAAEARAVAAEAEIPVLRRAAAAAEQALAADRDSMRQLTQQLAALQAWSSETAAELRELRATAARSLTPPPGMPSGGSLDGLLAAVRAS